MNIFVLDPDPVLAAKYHNDRHVSKMVQESAQMLSTAHYALDGPATAERRVHGLLRPVHINHPCAVWARANTGAYDWLHALMGGLLQQFALRYGRLHAYGSVTVGVWEALRTHPRNLRDGPRPHFTQAVPIKYRRADAVLAYRLYYLYEKAHIAQWSEVGEPPWWDELRTQETRWLLRRKLTAEAVH